MLLSFDQSAFKHGVSADEIQEVLADDNTIEIELEASAQGNYRIMYVGFTLAGKFLEVGVECVDADDKIFVHIYHANRTTAKFRAMYKWVRAHD